MQELLLFGQVAAQAHRILRQQLAGLAHMQPQPVLEKHLIFRPFPPSGLSNIPAGSGSHWAQQQELQKTRQSLNGPLSYVQLVGVVGNRVIDSQIEKQPGLPRENEDNDIVMTNDEDEPNQGHEALQWWLEFKDIPEPGKVSTTSRATSKTQIVEGDPIQFLKDLGYEYLSQYIITGDKFYDQDTTLFLHKVLQISDQGTQEPKIVFSTVNTVPDIAKFVPVDPSGGYILQASVEIADGNNPDLKDKATQQLLAMKETLRPSVNLAPGDRLALDTRVPVKRAQ